MALIKLSAGSDQYWLLNDIPHQRGQFDISATIGQDVVEIFNLATLKSVARGNYFEFSPDGITPYASTQLLIDDLKSFFFRSVAGGGGGSVNSVTGDGVGGTATDPVLTFPTSNEVDNDSLIPGANVTLALNELGVSTSDNATAIGTNATNIGLNTTAIGVNAGNINTNTTDIGTNATDIGTNATDIGTNATDISTNSTDIGNNTTNIGTNTTNIGNNSTDIGNNSTDIGNNTTNITTLETNNTGVNTGDETTLSIQTKRPLKTVNGTSLEGTGDIPISSGGESYTKIVVFEDTALNNFNSNTFTDVPGMQITINRDGDYTFSAFLNCNNDQNEEIDLTIALTPITNRVITLPDGSTVNVAAGTQFTSQFQAVRDRQQKNSDQTLTGLFLLNDLEINDLIDFQINTRNDNVDLSNRRAYGYTIN